MANRLRGNVNDTAANFTDPPSCASGAGGSLYWENNLAGTDFGNGRRVGSDAGGHSCDISHPCSDTTPLTFLAYVCDGNAEWPGGGSRQGALNAMAGHI